MKKKLLFVISSFSRAGAETALLELLWKLDSERFEISLFVLMSQGELALELPPYVNLLNTDYDTTSVLSPVGRRKLMKRALRFLCARGTAIRLIPYAFRNLWDMCRRGSFNAGMLIGRVLSEGAPRWNEEYDLAVGYLEGCSTYYVADHVKADKKVAFLHTNYIMNGYTRKQDLDCYRKMDKIFAVSESVKSCFLKIYPEHEHKLEIFHNMLNISEIHRKSRLFGGFTDGYSGTRLLTVGRLAAPKVLDISIKAMKLLKDAGGQFRWYVLGEGEQRSYLERKIRALGLTEDFVLCGAVDNPYPYFVQADLYVHASRYEGSSVSIREAQVLECVILASDCSGNRETVSDGIDGKLCSLTPEGIRDGILWLMEHPEERAKYAKAAGRKRQDQSTGVDKLLSLVGGN